MKFALVASNEPVYDLKGKAQIGLRVADTAAEPFAVSSACFWVQCENNVEADIYYYADGQILLTPQPEPKTIGLMQVTTL